MPENEIPGSLYWADVALVALGAVVTVAAVLHHVIARGGDPLRGSPSRPNRLLFPHIWLILLAYLAGWWIGSAIGARTAPPDSSAEQLTERQGIIGAALAQVLVTACSLVVARYAFLGGWRGLGLRRRRLRHELPLALAGWLAALSICGLTALATDWLLRHLAPGFKPPHHTVFRVLHDPRSSPVLAALAILGAGLLAPIGEELVFRGILQSAAARLLPARPRSLRHRWFGIVCVAVMFGGMHLPVPQHVPALIVLGLILGFLYERTGSLRVVIFIHLLFNVKSLVWYELARRLQN